LFLGYLLSKYLLLAPIPATGTEPEDFGVNWNRSKGPGKVKGLSAPGKLARQHDSCG
jgi:hypothetical protein